MQPSADLPKTGPDLPRAGLATAPRIIVGVTILGIVATGIVSARLWPEQVSAIVGWIERTEHSLGPAGYLLAAGVQVLIALCGVLPASVGAFAAGVTFGIGGGFLISGFATLIGAVLAFVLARGLFRPLVARALSKRPRMSLLNEAVAKDGWRLVALLRASPVMPFAATSYALGLTSLSMKQYLIGTLASLPALFGYVAIGHLSSTSLNLLASRNASPVQWAILGVAIGATALLTWRLARILRFVGGLPDAGALELSDGNSDVNPHGRVGTGVG